MQGDAEFAVAEKASYFTPVPGGIGPITIVKIFENLARLHFAQNSTGSPFCYNSAHRMKIWQTRLLALIILISGVGLGYFTYATEKEDSPFAFKLGLDLTGGTHLVYKADTSSIDSSEVGSAMEALRDVIERRVNLLVFLNQLCKLSEAQSFLETGKRDYCGASWRDRCK